MKIILTGSTGFIGREILEQCLTNPSVTSIIVLSRKPLSVSDPKLVTIIHKDFTTYTSEVMSQLEGADACIWSLGIANPPNLELAKIVNMDYTLAGARAMQKVYLNSLPKTKPFRFVYLSGMYTEKKQDASLWILGDARKLRGRVELELLGLVQEHKDKGFEVCLARPGFVVAKKKRVVDYAFGAVAKTIKVDWLARAMIEIAENGAGSDIQEMDELIGTGKRLMTS